MREDVERLTVALRVLMAFTEFRAPEDADVQTLHSYRPLSHRPADELACEVIQQVLKARGRISDGMGERVSRSIAGRQLLG